MKYLTRIGCQECIIQDRSEDKLYLPTQFELGKESFQRKSKNQISLSFICHPAQTWIRLIMISNWKRNLQQRHLKCPGSSSQMIGFSWWHATSCHLIPWRDNIIFSYFFLAIIFHLSLCLYRSDCRIYSVIKMQIQIFKIQTVSIEIIEDSHTRLLIASLTMFSVIWLSHAVPEQWRCLLMKA